MAEPIPCFWITPTEEVHRFLRRYATSVDTSKGAGHNGYHNAQVPLDTIKRPAKEMLYGSATHPPDDPRWPAACSCGYRFTSDDAYQVFEDRIYVRKDTGRKFPLDEAPPGAMYDAWWYHDEDRAWQGPDGLSLVCILPDRTHWTIDVPTSDGKPWTRTGTPPNVTATPSILTPSYHGFLTAGHLVTV